MKVSKYNGSLLHILKEMGYVHELDHYSELTHYYELIKTAQDVDQVPGAQDTLVQLWSADTPVWDGDVISKAGRDLLLSKGLAAKVVIRKEDGYQCCTYKGRSVVKLLNKGIGYYHGQPTFTPIMRDGKVVCFQTSHEEDIPLLITALKGAA